MTAGKRIKDGEITVISGMSGSGKSAYAIRQHRESKRLIVWDPEDDMAAKMKAKRITSAAALTVALLDEAQGGPGRWCYVPRSLGGAAMAHEFGFFCRVAMAWAVHYGPCDVIVEELADVSTAGKAPEGWGQLVRRGRKWGINTTAISQRWAESDKTTFGNAARVVIFRAASLPDASYISSRTGAASAQEVMDLQILHFLEVNRKTGHQCRGAIKF